MKEFGPKTITVLWDSGMKSTYRSDPEGGFYNLHVSHSIYFECVVSYNCYIILPLDWEEVINNSALGIKHSNILCGDNSCWVQEIQGIR